jgi:hypothetical protein
MGRYRKKPVVIEATQWFKNGDHPEDNVGETLHDPFAENPDNEYYERLEGAVVRFYRHPDDSGERQCEHCNVRMHDHGWIDTLEGGHNVCPGDWIITGVENERYPCKPDIFDKTYDAADELPEGEILALGWLSVELASRVDAWDGNAPKWFPEPPEWLELWEKAKEATQ